MNKRNKAALERQCEAWNSANVVGCEVEVTLDSGEVRRTQTRSEAQVLSGHTAVIWLIGIRGCYLLERVRSAARETAQ